MFALKPLAGADAPTVGTGNSTDRVYHAKGGFIYTSTQLQSVATVRPSAVILISANHRPFELRLRGQHLQATAAVIQPQVCRSLRALDVGLVSVNVHPTHPAYPSFQTLGVLGVMTLARERFSSFDSALRFASTGTLAPAQGLQLFEGIVQTTLATLPHQVPAHPLRASLFAALAHRNLSLADIALDFGVSYHRMSHLFHDVLGLSFRAYGSFELMRRASRQFEGDASLTAIAHSAGFTDSAHLSHTWRRRYGLSPSFVRDDNCVQAIR